MNIALLGYGKMGKEIEAIALQRGHTIVLKVDETNASQFQEDPIAIGWTSLSIPKNKSKDYNSDKFSKEKSKKHFTDDELDKLK